MLSDMPNITKEIDDCMMQGADDADLIPQLRKFFHRCRERQVALSRQKIQYGSTIEFSGCVVGEQGKVSLASAYR